ncbi:MAG: caspase family protein [Phaeodactylibacter sp.]|nr:caspase family protein [Phaeodactylibacter sp.]
MPEGRDGKLRAAQFDEDYHGSHSPSGKSWFLGIGINKYKEFSNLNNAAKDVQDIRALLNEKYGLQPENAITLLNEEANEENIIDHLDRLVEQVEEKDKLLIYYSGHGHLNKNTGLGYWIPYDAKKDKTARYIRNSTIRDYIKVIKARHILLISDSCFSGTLFVRGASRAAGAMEELERIPSRWAICSGRHDEEVYDGEPGKNSPFTECILEVLRENENETLNVAKVADRVVEQTRANYEQLPEGNPLYGVGHKGGQYIFRLTADEWTDWNSALKKNTLSQYRKYLLDYPRGKFHKEAEDRIEDLISKEKKLSQDRMAVEPEPHEPLGASISEASEKIRKEPSRQEPIPSLAGHEGWLRQSGIKGKVKWLIPILLIPFFIWGVFQLSSTRDSNPSTSISSPAIPDSDVIEIAIPSWAGFAGGIYFNEGFEASTQSRFYQEYGFKVKFTLSEDLISLRQALENEAIGLHGFSLDAFPGILPFLKEFNPVILWQTDWSRGGDLIVARRGITNMESLIGKKVALAPRTPSQSLFLSALEAGGMSKKDVEIITRANYSDVAALFENLMADAAVVRAPYHESCLKGVPGSTILLDTRLASFCIANIIFANREFVEQNQDKLQQLFEGWMRGNAEINGAAPARQKAVGILSKGMGLREETISKALGLMRLATYGDNRNFFGLNSEYQGVTGKTLYQGMMQNWEQFGEPVDGLPYWNSIVYPGFVQAATLTGQENAAEQPIVFSKLSSEEFKGIEALATKRASIHFRTGDFKLDENGQTIIDRELVDIAKAFSGARIRIEANTDNVGSRNANIELSRRRAQAVADYLISKHNIPANRIIVVGNGPDKPIASNQTDEGRAKNRRIDFQLLKD